MKGKLELDTTMVEAYLYQICKELINLQDLMKGKPMEYDHEPVHAKEQPEPQKEPEPQEREEEESKEEEKAETQPTITLDELRAAMARLNSSPENRKQLKGILEAHHAKKISELNPNDYDAIMKEVRQMEE